jgi:hypothetical protein
VISQRSKSGKPCLSLKRIALVRRAQCDLLGSFRSCANKQCRRVRTCSGDDPTACRERLWRARKVKPKTLRKRWSQIDGLSAL